MALDREQENVKKEQIIDAIGGKTALELLEKSSKWYALGQTKSPLDWRLVWGRCFANIVCERNEVAKLLPASLTLAKHNAQQLLAASVLFREQFDQKQYDQILAQAMKSNVSTASNSAKLIAMERTDAEVPISIFPLHHEILRSIASDEDAFTKKRFPETNRRLWLKAIELVALSPMTASRRETWLADAAFALGDAKGEISHLRFASLSEPNNPGLHFRFASRLLDVADPNTEEVAVEEVRKAIKQLKRMDSASIEAKILEERVNQL